jgi:hypothetical protein
LGIRIVTEPGTVGCLLAALLALEFILRRKKVQVLTVGTFAGNETLKVPAVSRIRKSHEEKCNCKK